MTALADLEKSAVTMSGDRFCSPFLRSKTADEMGEAKPIAVLRARPSEAFSQAESVRMMRRPSQFAQSAHQLFSARFWRCSAPIHAGQ